MPGGRPPCLRLRAAVSSPSNVDSRMFSRSGSAIAAENANSSPLPRTARVADTGQGLGEHLQGRAVGGEVVGERGEFGGVAAEPFHRVDGEDDPAVPGVRLDLPGRAERLLELRAARTRVLIFSLKILSRGMSCLLSASSWESSSCPSVGQRAYPMRMSALGRSGSMGAGGGVPGRQGRPGPRSAGVGTRSALFSRGTRVKRRV